MSTIREKLIYSVLSGMALMLMALMSPASAGRAQCYFLDCERDQNSYRELVTPEGSGRLGGENRGREGHFSDDSRDGSRLFSRPDSGFKGPSFTCGAGLTRTEKRICTVPLLSRLDVRLASRYKELKQSLSRKERHRLRRTQKSWLRQREACGGDEGCIRETYRERLRILERF